jgi:hypothetical protein
MFELRSVHIGFVVEKVAVGQTFCEYLGFPCQFSFQRNLKKEPRSQKIFPFIVTTMRT